MSRRTIATVKRPEKHAFQPDPDLGVDHRGDTPCTCGLPRRSNVHDLPDTTEADAASRRRAGEHE